MEDIGGTTITTWCAFKANKDKKKEKEKKTTTCQRLSVERTQDNDLQIQWPHPGNSMKPEVFLRYSSSYWFQD